MKDLTALEKFYLDNGFSKFATQKMLQDCGTRNPALIRQHMVDYRAMLQVDQPTLVKMATMFPGLFEFDILSDSPTSVKSKIKDLQTLFNADVASIVKMAIKRPMLLGCDILGDGPTAIKSKFTDLQRLLQAPAPAVAKAVMIFPGLVLIDVNGDGPTAVASKLQDLQSVLQVSARQAQQIALDFPNLLGCDIKGDSPTAVEAKMNKLSTVIPADVLHDWVINDPRVLTMPAQACKIRYMLAVNNGVEPLFLNQKGYMVNQSKVWARACYLNKYPNTFNMANLYIGEKPFSKRFGTNSDELMHIHPLDERAVNRIEQMYVSKTGNNLTLDAQEREYLGLGN